MDSVGLLEASKRGLAGNVQQLLANGADPNARDAVRLTTSAQQVWPRTLCVANGCVTRCTVRVC